MSPPQLLPLRILVGLLGLLFTYSLGRVGAELHIRRQPLRKATTWLLRVIVTLGAVLWTGGLDAITIVFFALAAVVFVLAVYLQMRPRRAEDIHIAPED
jgi:hypothetical protein